VRTWESTGNISTTLKLIASTHYIEVFTAAATSGIRQLELPARPGLLRILFETIDDNSTVTNVKLMYIHSFLRATAGTAIARLSHRNSVRLSVCLSHGWIRQSGAS